jgi:DNA-binding CsgD family transcriptional regulator
MGIVLPPPIVVPRLSAIEAQVLALCAQGLRDDEIADELGRTRHQIKYAIRNAMARLGATSRPHAVVTAIHLGFLVLRQQDHDPNDQDVS